MSAQQHDCHYKEDAQRYHRVMQCLQNMKMEHGTCKPRSRMACTHCNAKDELEKMVAEYSGPPIILADKG